MHLKDLNDNQLLQMYLNCMDAIHAGRPTAARALALVKEVNAVWELQLTAAMDKKFKADTPEVGLLKTVGYRVGKSGEKQQRRWEILDMVMSQELPFVGSPAYMYEWGDPLSCKRYRKLHRVLASFRSGGKHFSNMEVAVEHWEQDIVHIERNWKTRSCA